MSEKTEVDLTGAKQNHGVWLVKVCFQYLAQQCAKASGKGEVSFTLNEDLINLSAFEEKAASVRALQDHPMTMHSVGGKTLAVFTESFAGNSQLPCSSTGKTPWRYGSFELTQYSHTAKTTQEWLRDKSLNVLECPSQRPHRNPDRTSLERPENVCAATLPIQPDRYEKRKKAEGRMVRADRQQVMDMLFSAFEEHQYYNIKDLVEVAKQPVTYLKEILREIGVYNAKGTHKSTWELKPEYRHYQGRR
uniref:General transcription factor IIF subunit 2 n=1 Tax=Salmo trutta TaxID=8032 RepID=A0A673XTX0_SALTR